MMMMAGPFAPKMANRPAHYEHTICVKKNKADILSSFTEIEQNESVNSNLDSSYLEEVKLVNS